MIDFSAFQYQGDKEFYRFQEPVSRDYRVYLNGREIPVYTCSISAWPFNTIWPGHQRPVSQTVGASFVNLVCDEAVTLEVEPLIPCERPLLKPYSRHVEMEKTNGRCRFTLTKNGGYVFMCGTYQHCLYIFNSRPSLCEDLASVTHYFGPGIHFAGKITLHDNESLYVDKDALVYGCIYARGASNVRVFGNGLFDDSTEERVGNYCYEEYTNGNIKFYDCENVSVEGVLFRNSAIWCVNLFGCRCVKLDDVKVFGQWRYNTDGVDVVNSQDISIENSFIHSFDDTITIKGIDVYKEISNQRIHVKNCVLWCDWGKTCEVGIETVCREYSDISFTHCDILRAGNTALDIQSGDCAEIHDILYADINVEYNAFDSPPLYQAREDQVYDLADQHDIPHLVSIRNYPFKTPDNIQAWGLADGPLPDLTGIHPGCVRDVTVRNINVWYDPLLPLKDGKYDVRVIVQRDRGETPFSNIRVEGISVNEKPYEDYETQICL